MTEGDVELEVIDICREAFKAHRAAVADAMNRDFPDGHRMSRHGAAQALGPVLDRLMKLQNAIIQAKNASGHDDEC
jgi:hypothetical protein